MPVVMESMGYRLKFRFGGELNDFYASVNAAGEIG